MVHLIRLHRHSKDKDDRVMLLVNPDNISFISPLDDGGSCIHFCCSTQGQHFQVITVMESLYEIESLIKKS